MTTLRICFVGDSITQGTIDADCLGWPGRLGQREQASGHDVTVYNLGVRAETSRQIAARWRRECEPRLPDIVPGALVFAFGVNDMAEDPEAGIRVPIPESIATARDMVGTAAAWKPTLWVGPGPADMDRQPFSPAPGISYSFHNDRVVELNSAYTRLAADLGVPYLDIYETLSADRVWAAALARGDGVHPSADGYALLARLVGDWPAWRAWFDD